MKTGGKRHKGLKVECGKVAGMGAPRARPGVSPDAGADVAVPRCALNVAGGQVEVVKAGKIAGANVQTQKMQGCKTS